VADMPPDLPTLLPGEVALKEGDEVMHYVMASHQSPAPLWVSVEVNRSNRFAKPELIEWSVEC
jgi:hypothetical protein